jgi:subtilase family serine protease
MEFSFSVRTLYLTALLFLVTNQALAVEKLERLRRAHGNQVVEFEVFLPLRNARDLDQLLSDLHTPGAREYHHWLTPAEFGRRFGPQKEDLDRVGKALEAYGFTVTRLFTQAIRVRGHVDAAETAFATRIWEGVSAAGTRKLVTDGQISLPAPLIEAGAHIAEFRHLIPNEVYGRRSRLSRAPVKSNAGPYLAIDVKRAYDFPSSDRLDGRGVAIGIVMSSDYSPADIKQYFGLEHLREPDIIRSPIAGGAEFSSDSPASVEAEVDIEQAGTMAPHSKLILYTTPDLSDSSVLSAYTRIIDENRADIVTSSFGGPESLYGPAYNGGVDFTGILTVYDDLFRQGIAQGITFVASSGDAGALASLPPEYFSTTPTTPPQIVGDFSPGVDTPASSPHVTAVGGTNLITFDPPGRGNELLYLRENADGDPLLAYDPYGLGNLVGGGYWGSGGGVSMYFSKPDYQRLVHDRSQYRMLPDVAFHMGGCPDISIQPCGNDRSSDYVVFAGQVYTVIGTSASAPAFAGLLALREQLYGRLGNVNYLLYALAHDQASDRNMPAKYFHQDIPGYNGYYYTQYGYNLVIGNGTIIGRSFIHARDLRLPDPAK